jgi:hypothetical protein
MIRLVLGILTAALVAVAGPNRAAEPDAPKPAVAPAPTQVLTGKVAPVTPAADPSKPAVTLTTADGKTYPLLEDNVSRILFLEPKLHDRQVQLTVAPPSGSDPVKVTQVRVLVEGVPHEAYYWCEKCQLRASEPGLCKCCNGPTEYVEVPVKPKK